ncbi:hypothetical protein GF323_04855 [Candidatus Woesearchaeota archaeon]|nr:hypothetical protein [Candidatus Woesearchaeota archaeon]
MDKQLEIRRKVFHLLFGILLVFLIFYNFIGRLILAIIILASFLLLLLARKVNLPVISWCLRNFERPEIRKKFPGRGSLFYLAGAELSLLLFSKNIAMASIIILAIGDSIPNIVGMHFGRIRHPFSDKRFLEGAAIGIVIAAIAAHIFVVWYEALIASVFAVFLEGIDIKLGLEKVDDNLIVPLSAGIAITLIRMIT